DLVCLDLLATKDHPQICAFFKEALQKRIEVVIPFALRSRSVKEHPEVVENLIPFLDHEDFIIRSVALQTLLSLDASVAFKRLLEDLADKRPVIKRTAIGCLGYIQRIPPQELLESLAVDPDPEVRAQIAGQLVAFTERLHGSDLDPMQSALHILEKDSRPEIRLKAIEGLYCSGQKELAIPYLRKLEGALGVELREAISFISHITEFRDRAGQLLIRRFREDPELQGSDRLAIVSGLTDMKAAEAVGLFFEIILGGWNARTLMIDPFTLDLHTALKVHNLDKDVLPEWLRALDQDRSNQMAYLFINGVRNLENPLSTDPLLELASDPGRPMWIRREAVLSFAFFKTNATGERLLAFSKLESDPELSALAFKVFWNFY
ncbi:MAG: HEAT repeat domain-containing protein, partial [Planctomycetota bacterium]